MTASDLVTALHKLKKALRLACKTKCMKGLIYKGFSENRPCGP
jgi:hypothetical protein